MAWNSNSEVEVLSPSISCGIGNLLLLNVKIVLTSLYAKKKNDFQRRVITSVCICHLILVPSKFLWTVFFLTEALRKKTFEKRSRSKFFSLRSLSRLTNCPTVCLLSAVKGCFSLLDVVMGYVYRRPLL